MRPAAHARDRLPALGEVGEGVRVRVEFAVIVAVFHGIKYVNGHTFELLMGKHSDF